MPPAPALPPPPGAPLRSPPASVAGEVEVQVAGRDGGPSIEARVHVPSEPRRVVLLCHPHPLYGGSMHSPVPLAIARMLAERASDEVAWARFNMRGVGASEGTYDGGRGELEDARSVFGYLGAQCTGVPAAVCGHSFGAWVGFRLAVEEAHADRALLVAPTPHFTFEPPGEGRHLRVAVFIGDCDELAPVAEAMAIAHVIGADLRVFPGYDHHFLKSRRALAEAALPVIAPEVASP